MEFGMRHLCYQLPPTTKQPPPPPSARSSAGAWPRSSSHLAVLLGRRPPRRATRALRVAVPNSSHLDATCTKSIRHQDRKLRVDKFFEKEMTVRDCDLDQYGIVSNAVYADYIGKAREECAASLGISEIARTGRAMALSEQNIKYLAPLKRGARFVVMVRVVQIKGARILVEHFIETLPERKLILEATATVVCVNEDYRPTRVFPEVSSKVLRFFSS